MPILELVAEHGTGLFYSILDDDLVIGRLPECEIRLSGERVSRRHARVSRSGTTVRIEDLGSRNGTSVNGERIEQPTELVGGDEIVIDQSRLVYHAEAVATRADSDRPSEVTGTLILDPDTTVQPSANPEAQLAAVTELSTQLARSTSSDQILLTVLGTLFRVFPGVERGLVLLADEDEEMHAVVRRVRDGDDRAPFSPVWSVCRQVYDEGRAILCVGGESTEFPRGTSGGGTSRPVMCAPLTGTEDVVLGVVQVDRDEEDRPFELADLELLAAVVAMAGRAVENVRLHAEHLHSQLQEQELQLAARVQRMLVPEESPDIPGFDVYHYYEPHREVGGDYFDYIPLSGGRTAIAIGDVTGKGVAAALLMARVNAAVRLCLDFEPELATAVGRMNGAVIDQNVATRFVTFLLAVVDPAEEEVALVVAGHIPPVVRRADGTVVVIDSDLHGPPLGIVDDAGYSVFRMPLAAGESFVLCTDGVSEAYGSDRVLFGMDRLVRAVASADVSAEAIGRNVLAEVRTHTGTDTMNDDTCVIVVHRTGEPRAPSLGFAD